VARCSLSLIGLITVTFLALAGCSPTLGNQIPREIPLGNARGASLEVADLARTSTDTTAVGATSEFSVQLTNPGPGTVTQIQPSPGFELHEPFYFKGGQFPGDGGTCGSNLGSGETCTMVLTYQPQTSGPHRESLSLHYLSDSTLVPVEIGLTGTTAN